ncbi:hypothetical protein [Candidatus Electronema sp. TJ]|uniref:hypothetical protein n=1 Tax=Candidatus Electronema sp. TJ TaxID=3401573 RepID=UPI003AA8CC0D
MPRKNIVLGLLASSILSAVPSQGAELELVWSQSDGLRYEIYHSTRNEGVWEPPEKLTDNNANNLHPAFVITPDGNRWIFWSAVNPDGIAIEYTTGKDGRWAEPVKLEMEEGSTAIAPSALAAQDGSVWLVWSGSSGGGQDEIYWSRYAASGWQKPKMVNMANQVPDIKPELALNAQKQMEVRWQGFRDGQYKMLISAYAGSGWLPEQEMPEEKKPEEKEKPELPDFVPASSQHVLLDLSSAKEGAGK